METKVKSIFSSLELLEKQKSLTKKEKLILDGLQEEKFADLDYLFSMYDEFQKELAKKIRSMEKRIKPICKKYEVKKVKRYK